MTGTDKSTRYNRILHKRVRYMRVLLYPFHMLSNCNEIETEIETKPEILAKSKSSFSSRVSFCEFPTKNPKNNMLKDHRMLLM